MKTRYECHPSPRNAILDVQDELNKMPLHKLGAMLTQADNLRKSADEKDKAIGNILREQVLLAMDPANDTDRNGPRENEYLFISREGRIVHLTYFVDLHTSSVHEMTPTWPEGVTCLSEQARLLKDGREVKLQSPGGPDVWPCGLIN